ncbi:MAG: adenylate/guanylate cyclase domain-containing protein, partial [Hyphomicrobiales bacterium]|nr:adenylate/guanylate cyclase domain-containing protein [Hyphomicrobiales bacterium]
MSPQHVERKLAAILVADVVGYSRLVGTDEEGTIARLRATRDELIDPSIARHNGRIVKTMGDGLLIEFTSVVDAVRSAAEVQRAMAERNTGAPGSERIEFRVGINLGDVVVEGDDIMGDGVNVAARLEGLAEPGGVCISGTAFDQVRDKLDVGYEHLGEQEVKNIARPVRVYKVLLRPADEGKMVGVKPTGRPQKLRWAAAAAIILGVFTAGGVWWWQPWLPGIETASVA